MSDDTHTRQGSWCQTRSGKQFWPLDPRPEDICIEDLAAHLSKVCRYGGAARRFYSVAEHCVLVSRLVPQEFAMEGLLHDSAEAYIGDMIRPLKHQPEMSEFRRVEAAIELCVRVKFNLRVTPECWTEVKEADDRILVDEINALMRRPDLYLPRLDHARGYGIPITGWDPSRAEAEFLERFDDIRWGRDTVEAVRRRARNT